MASRTLERLALGATSVGCAGALGLYVYLIVWPSWQQNRQTAAMVHRIAEAMEERMAEVATGQTENLANEIQSMMQADREGPYARWDRIILLLIPLGLAFLGFVGFLALRFGVRLAMSELALLVSVAGILFVLPAWLPSKSEFQDFFVRVTFAAATFAGTIAAVFIVAKGKESVYAVVGVALIASSGCGAALGFLMAMPAWQFAAVVAHMLIGAAAGAFPGTLAGVVAGYLYGRSQSVSGTAVASRA